MEKICPLCIPCTSNCDDVIIKLCKSMSYSSGRMICLFSFKMLLNGCCSGRRLRDHFWKSVIRRTNLSLLLTLLHSLLLRGIYLRASSLQPVTDFTTVTAQFTPLRQLIALRMVADLWTAVVGSWGLCCIHTIAAIESFEKVTRSQPTAVQPISKALQTLLIVGYLLM